MASIVIQGGRVIDPASGVDARLDIAIEDGVINSIEPSLSSSGADEVIDASGLIVTPGLIDPHVHLREPGAEESETIESGREAAARGGYTSVACMPNTKPALDTPEMIEFVRTRASSPSGSRVFAIGAVSKGRRGEQLAEIALMAKAGAVGFSDDGDVVASAGLMAAALRAVKAAGRALMQHCQEPTLTQGASMHAGVVATRLGLVGWPAVAEEIIVERDIRLASLIGARYHVQHVSSGATVEILRRARSDQALASTITAEASPHHLLLTADACDGYNTLAKVNPPLREQADTQAIRQGVADGTITVLATDHAPHTAESKAADFASAPFGMVGISIALPLYIEALVQTGLIDWPRLIELLTINPAKLCGLDQLGLGSLKAGGPADVTLIDPSLAWTIQPGELGGRSTNTPFLGRKVAGRAVRTIVAGRSVWSLAPEAKTA